VIFIECIFDADLGTVCILGTHTAVEQEWNASTTLTAMAMRWRSKSAASL